MSIHLSNDILHDVFAQFPSINNSDFEFKINGICSQLPNYSAQCSRNAQRECIDDFHFFVDSDALFQKLSHFVLNNLDLSTQKDGAVFWSGENRCFAEQWAKDNGHMTLEMTPGGAILDSLDLFNVKNTYPRPPLDYCQAASLWDMASSKFANAAKGIVRSFAIGISPINLEQMVLRTWFRVELPILVNSNEEISRIIWMNNNGTINDIYSKF